MVLRRHAEHIQDFFISRGFGVGGPKADGNSAALQRFLDQGADLFPLFRCCHTVCCVPARQQSTRVVHHGHARGNVPGARSEIDARLPFPFAVPLIDIGNSNFKLERRRHAVRGFRGIVFRVLPMLV